MENATTLIPLERIGSAIRLVRGHVRSTKHQPQVFAHGY
jgi:hypothetical protein